MTGRAVCGGCGAYLATGTAVCERCGWQASSLGEAGPTPELVERLFGASWHGLWKWVWVLWTIAYPMLTVSAYVENGGQDSGAFASLLVAGSLAWPWLVGVITFGVLYTVTRPEHGSQ
jgi:hypothetical protein